MIKYIFIHNSAVSLVQPDQLSNINEFHRQQFNMKSSLGYWVGYNALMDAWGNVVTCRTDGEETAAVAGHNTDSLHICLVGNFDNEYPTTNQRHALRAWLKTKMSLHNIPPENVKGHRWADSAKAQGKTCPGRYLTDKEIFEMADWARQEKEAKEKYELAEKTRKETEEKMKSAMTKLIELLQLKVEELLKLLKLK